METPRKKNSFRHYTDISGGRSKEDRQAYQLWRRRPNARGVRAWEKTEEKRGALGKTDDTGFLAQGITVYIVFSAGVCINRAKKAGNKNTWIFIWRSWKLVVELLLYSVLLSDILEKDANLEYHPS